ncbi:MAG: electron transfer flavoprotein subunit alpha/FixB family protein [Pleomorphochaeta sp.]
MKKVLIYVEENFRNESLSLLEASRQLYINQNVETYALVINSKEDSPLEGFFDKVLKIEDTKLQLIDQKAIGEIYSQLQKIYNFDAILFLATSIGRCLAPSVAMKLKTGIVADVTAISNKNNQVSLIRPAYSGKIMAAIKVLGDGPIMMSVRSGIFLYNKVADKKTSYIFLNNLKYNYCNIKVKKVEKKVIPYDIKKSDVLVSAGAGCTDIEELEKLASLLNGNLSASRAVVDKKIVSRSIQVGQSGKTVSPSLYIAFGIHGALQHVEGLKDIPFIISININKDAPICSISDIVVEGDAIVFLKKLISKISEHANG